MSTAPAKRQLPSLRSNPETPFFWSIAFAWIAVMLAALILARALNTQLQMAFVLSAGWTMVASAPLPLRLALRVQLCLGAAFVLMLSLGTVTSGSPLAAVTLAILVSVFTLTWWVRVIGPMVATLPVVAFIIGALGVTHGMTMLKIVQDVVLGTAAGVMFALVTKVWDSRKRARMAVAKAWLPQSPTTQRIAAARTVHLDGHPDDLTSLARDATRTHLGLQFLRSAQSPQSQSLIAAIEDQSQQIAAALRPRGPLVPRQVPDVDAQALMSQASEANLTQLQKLGLETAASSIADATRVLAGKPPGINGLTFGDSIAREYLTALRHPDPFLRSWAIQRAVVLGLAMLAVVLSGLNLDFIWAFVGVLLTLNPFSGLVVGVQRFIGTTAGIVLAAALSIVVPVEILYPYLAVCVFGIGLGYIQRNYAIFAAGLGFFIALAVGIPHHNVPLWAGLRSLDTLIGVIIGVVASRLILVPKVSPPARVQRVSTALDALCAEILHQANADRSSEQELRLRLAHAEAAVEAMAAELAIESNAGISDSYPDAGANYRAALDELRLTCCLLIKDADAELVRSHVRQVQARYQGVTDAVLGAS